MGQFKLRTSASERSPWRSKGLSGVPKTSLRPAGGGTPSFAAEDPFVFDAEIEKIEFRVVLPRSRSSAAFAPHWLTVYLSLNSLTEQALNTGSALRLKLLPERLRVF